MARQRIGKHGPHPSVPRPELCSEAIFASFASILEAAVPRRSPITWWLGEPHLQISADTSEVVT
jgi:hypothetical protein